MNCGVGTFEQAEITHVNPYTGPASILWDMGKQCRIGLGAAEREVWSRSALFAN